VAGVVVEDGAVTADTGPAAEVPWWSFTKTVLATAALALVRDGHLRLDPPLPGRPYSLRQLLQHRAGLTDYGFLPAYHEAVARHENAWPAQELLERSKADRLLHAPGERFSYSNIGYFFVRRLIEETTEQDLGSALDHLVLRPLGIGGARLAMRRSDLADVSMGETGEYDPCWVYHGLLVGPLRQAALLLDRLMSGNLLPPDLKAAMRERHPVGGPIAGRPWTTPGYALGLMSGGITGGGEMTGHTGGGPGTTIAVYHSFAPGPPRTAAAFSASDNQGLVEGRCVLLLGCTPARKDR
jgi:CubicO group peptidase (beta-lactamase class C family)